MAAKGPIPQPAYPLEDESTNFRSLQTSLLGADERIQDRFAGVGRTIGAVTIRTTNFALTIVLPMGPMFNRYR